LYIPEHFRVRDHAAAVAFMRRNPFVILISNTPDGPFATHLPVVIEETEVHLVLRGHVAKANPHWRYLEEQSAPCLTVFHGPHAYISPTHYTLAESVPTWNYGTVHAYGRAKVFQAPEDLLGILHQLIPTFEASYRQQWESMSQTYRDNMLRHIVGFEIAVNRLEAKFKLSQNRTRQEQQNVIASLSVSGDTAVSSTAQLMTEQGLGTNKPQE
jgi:transcriptional regulator